MASDPGRSALGPAAARIFINYRKVDSAFVAIMLDIALAARFGSDRVFRDSRSIPLGVEFDQAIWSSLNASDILLVVIGPNWFVCDDDGVPRIHRADDYVRREIAIALASGMHVVPILLEDTALPPRSGLPDDPVQMT